LNSLSILMHFISFSCLVALAKTSTGGETRHACLVRDLAEMLSVFPSFSLIAENLL
jgi:hypothetical protein